MAGIRLYRNTNSMLCRKVEYAPLIILIGFRKTRIVPKFSHVAYVSAGKHRSVRREMFENLAKSVRGVVAILGMGVLTASCSNPWTKLPDNETTTALRASLQRPGRMNHGNYCGFGTVDGTLRQKPTDKLDAACQAHDICYIESIHHCVCDEWLKRDVAAIIEDPSTEKSIRRRARLVRSTFALPVCKAFPQGVMPPRDRKLLESINQAEG